MSGRRSADMRYPERSGAQRSDVRRWEPGAGGGENGELRFRWEKGNVFWRPSSEGDGCTTRGMSFMSQNGMCKNRLKSDVSCMCYHTLPPPPPRGGNKDSASGGHVTLEPTPSQGALDVSPAPDPRGFVPCLSGGDLGGCGDQSKRSEGTCRQASSELRESFLSGRSPFWKPRALCTVGSTSGRSLGE